ncbi:filamin-c [Plakobranchus ocellatus]|uniref:Filamin-c n=1 Tax=Plakobranchus ocellatus TaxID=259542 RepID=A0AAV4AHU4_9GAST|nr:filamin-c [Plakobranchus ocellatus]
MTGTFDPDKLKVEAVAPTGRVIRITGDGHYAAPFNGDEIGRWKVSMYYDGRYMDGCPIDVCDPSQVKIRDLQGGHVGKPNSFHVDCTKAGPGDLGVDITLNGRPVSTNISPTSTPGYFKVTFTPFAPGPYEINVHFNRAEVREGDVTFFDPDERQRKAVFITRVDPKPDCVEVKSCCDWEVDYITGKPFICHVTDSTDISVYGMEDGTVCAHPELIADCTRVGEGNVTAEVTHHGLRYPCKVRKDRPDVYRVSFKPRGPGTYKVWINYDGQPVKGSPFVQEIAELEKPTAHGDGLYRGVPGKPATFTVDPRGFPGQVSVAVNGPSRPVSSQLEPQPDSTIKATYFPNERGPHTVHVKLDGKNIDGSPYHPLIVDPVSVRVSGGWRPYLDEKGLIPLKVNKEKHLPFDVSEAGPGELTSEIQGPNGKIPVTIDARNDGKHSVIFTPREQGKHYIHVNWGGYPLHNSPYMGYATYEPEEEEEYPNVRLVPIHLHSPTNHASPHSSLGGSFVDGPVPVGRAVYSPVPSGPQRQDPALYYDPVRRVTISQPVIHDVVLTTEPPHPPPRVTKSPRFQVVSVTSPNGNSPGFQDYPPSSPRSVSVRSTTSQPKSPNGPQKVILSGRGLKEAEVNQPANFYVDGTQANPGKPRCHLQGVKDQLPVSVENVRPQVYKCTYIPERPGAYLLYVNWNDKPLKGSPYKVAIREPARPHHVIASLDRPNTLVGEDLEMKIDPRKAGPGHLTVQCINPLGQEVPCRLADNYDGTRSLKVTPTMPGRYIVEIRYDGAHIMGSPYAIDIKKQDIGLLPVKVWGPGIENGVIPNFHSTFWVETTGAGAGDLRVRIMGPKGAFHVKMRKASQRDKIYQCFYDPVEPGIYTVYVQWSGVHVAGSPFQVLLATSERELERMQEVLNEGGTHSTINAITNNHNHHFNSSRSDLDNDIDIRRNRDSRKSSSRPSSGREINGHDLNDILY